MTLKNNISKVTDNLDKLDENREKILKISRQITRKCSNAIKAIHREEFNDYENQIEIIKRDLNEYRDLINTNPGYFHKYLSTPEQEYVEAICLYSIIQKKKIPNYEELEVDALHYTLGLADVVGELRRFILDSIRNSDIDNLNRILETMDEIYTYLFSLDYPSGLTKDLRHKTDTARRLIEKTRGDISLSLQMDKLSELLKENSNK
ncbi:MAG: haloacid dehalogenase [Candidatus Lokiarchaeota archaeon]|nr:haloacid dehalogenase [Candidatus Lokiarchaeota archaeon]MBD3198786.1 haloacid dehalogenase [Candidatus Lokiarchaeota archaeon]